MKEDAYRVIDAFWSQDLNVPSINSTESLSCVVHQDHGVQLFRRNGNVLISAAPRYVERLQLAIHGILPEEVFSVDWLAETLREDVEKILGPAEVTYADPTNFGPPEGNAARVLSETDMPAYAALQAALSESDYEASGFTAGVFPAFGVFQDSILCAGSNYVVWEPSIAHIHVATHPEYRRRGFAKDTIRALAVHAFERNFILQWRALASNTNSLSLAYDLGFEHYCTTIYGRCRAT